jgi:hypothetical protein
MTPVMGDSVKHLSIAIVAFLLAANASAEECIQKTEVYQDKPVSYEMCLVRVDDVVKASVDGFVQIHYIVQYKSQRFVVEDPLARSDHLVGDQICIFVSKHEARVDAHSKGWLFAHVYYPKPTDHDHGCQP